MDTGHCCGIVIRTWLENYRSSAMDPFMVATYMVKERMRDKIPAVVHIDGTCRPQLVTNHLNGRYYRMIKEFHKNTKVPMVLNTSFNVDEPIVATAEDALMMFKYSGLDLLVIEDYIVRK